jgi:hypothetical protein
MNRTEGSDKEAETWSRNFVTIRDHESDRSFGQSGRNLVRRWTELPDLVQHSKDFSCSSCNIVMKAPGATLPRLTSKEKLLKSKVEEHSHPLTARFCFIIFLKQIYRL